MVGKETVDLSVILLMLTKPVQYVGVPHMIRNDKLAPAAGGKELFMERFGVFKQYFIAAHEDQ